MKESNNAVERVQRGGGFFSDEFKQRLIAEVSHPGASLSRVARKHGVGISTLSNWRKQYQRQTDTVELIPIAVSPPSTPSRPPDELMSECSTCFSEQTAPGLLEITLERATIQITGLVDTEIVRVALESLRGC